MARLIHTGNVVIDLVLRVPRLPQRGGDVLAKTAVATPGGGFNLAAAAARQGVSVVYAGGHGTGPWGDLARAALAVEGVSCVAPPQLELDTGYVVALVEPDGERSFVTAPGAEAQLRLEWLEATAPQAGDWVYVSGYSLAHAANRAALLAWLPSLDWQVSVVFDPGPLVASLDPAALRVVLARADWVTANEPECLVLAGAESVEEALAGRAPRGRGGLVLRLGAAGCVVAFAMPGSVPQRVASFPVTAVDTNGAGDAHTGVFVAGLMAGLDPVQAARRANAGAALAVVMPGPATAPAPAAIDALISQNA
ncbi:MAG: PfkB family carbohydrate kinase [Bifidobacteriaceae bacterium]|jgi:sugar/nucleoside kinase (ribokinase family)|nr:PfkB family carbohydrate kinase [Bifidobacteriaceae bacterium]